MHLHNICPEVKKQIDKLARQQHCANAVGQIGIEAVANPPARGMPSYELYSSERDLILSHLEQKAQIMYRGLNDMVNV